MSAASGVPEWQQTLKARLIAQQLENDVYKEIFDDCAHPPIHCLRIELIGRR